MSKNEAIINNSLLFDFSPFHEFDEIYWCVKLLVRICLKRLTDAEKFTYFSWKTCGENKVFLWKCSHASSSSIPWPSMDTGMLSTWFLHMSLLHTNVCLFEWSSSTVTLSAHFFSVCLFICLQWYFVGWQWKDCWRLSWVCVRNPLTLKKVEGMHLPNSLVSWYKATPRYAMD